MTAAPVAKRDAFSIGFALKCCRNIKHAGNYPYYIKKFEITALSFIKAILTMIQSHMIGNTALKRLLLNSMKAGEIFLPAQGLG